MVSTTYLYCLLQKRKDISVSLLDFIFIVSGLFFSGYFGSRLCSVIDYLLGINKDITIPLIVSNFFSINVFEWYGGLLFTLFFLFVCKFIYQADFYNFLLLCLTKSICIVLAIGKFGCFLSGHHGCYGKETNLPWACSFHYGLNPPAHPVHPIQLYDIVFNTVIFFLIVKFEKMKIGGIAIFLGYISIFCCYNFFMESQRDVSKTFSIFSLGQICYAIIFVIGSVTWVMGVYTSRDSRK